MTELEKIKIRVQIGITVIGGLFSLYLIATEPADSAKLKWGIGFLGIVIGYWLK